MTWGGQRGWQQQQHGMESNPRRENVLEGREVGAGEQPTIRGTRMRTQPPRQTGGRAMQRGACQAQTGHGTEGVQVRGTVRGNDGRGTGGRHERGCSWNKHQSQVDHQRIGRIAPGNGGAQNDQGSAASP